MSRVAASEVTREGPKKGGFWKRWFGEKFICFLLLLFIMVTSRIGDNGLNLWYCIIFISFGNYRYVTDMNSSTNLECVWRVGRLLFPSVLLRTTTSLSRELSKNRAGGRGIPFSRNPLERLGSLSYPPLKHIGSVHLCLYMSSWYSKALY